MLEPLRGACRAGLLRLAAGRPYGKRSSRPAPMDSMGATSFSSVWLLASALLLASYLAPLSRDPSLQPGPTDTTQVLHRAWQHSDRHLSQSRPSRRSSRLSMSPSHRSSP